MVDGEETNHGNPRGTPTRQVAEVSRARGSPGRVVRNGPKEPTRRSSRNIVRARRHQSRVRGAASRVCCRSIRGPSATETRGRFRRRVPGPCPERARRAVRAARGARALPSCVRAGRTRWRYHPPLRPSARPEPRQSGRRSRSGTRRRAWLPGGHQDDAAPSGTAGAIAGVRPSSNSSRRGATRDLTESMWSYRAAPAKRSAPPPSGRCEHSAYFAELKHHRQIDTPFRRRLTPPATACRLNPTPTTGCRPPATAGARSPRRARVPHASTRTASAG